MKPAAAQAAIDAVWSYDADDTEQKALGPRGDWRLAAACDFGW
jgi:hypothetical protein